ncbi:hypothetical protein SDC9_172686 [bioreactor metagenome]|uniref:Uncharacterized protein n=1 Tax=bioreactor metagenome TaxID=1076179 RepID=A0A645GHN5_9ZZZZ
MNSVLKIQGCTSCSCSGSKVRLIQPEDKRFCNFIHKLRQFKFCPMQKSSCKHKHQLSIVSPERIRWDLKNSLLSVFLFYLLKGQVFYWAAESVSTGCAEEIAAKLAFKVLRRLCVSCTHGFNSITQMRNATI